MNEAVRHLRHELLNQVNHIVGYAELLLEEAEDAGEAEATGPLVSGLGEIRAAGKQVMAAVNRVLDPDDDVFDREELQATLGQPLSRVTQVVGELGPASGEEAAQVLDQIAGAARRALELAADGADVTERSGSVSPSVRRPAAPACRPRGPALRPRTGAGGGRRRRQP